MVICIRVCLHKSFIHNVNCPSGVLLRFRLCELVIPVDIFSVDPFEFTPAGLDLITIGL